MTSEEVLLEKFKILPPDLKREVEHFVEFLQTKIQTKTPRVSLEGIWADMDVNLTEEDFREACREMWKNFPRERFFENEEGE